MAACIHYYHTACSSLSSACNPQGETISCTSAKNHFYFLLIPEILLQSSWLLSSGTLTPESVDSGFGFKYRGGVLVRFINSSHLYPLRLSGPLWGLHTRGSRGHWSSWEQVWSTWGTNSICIYTLERRGWARLKVQSPHHRHQQNKMH